MKQKYHLITGCEAALAGAREAGAKVMFGYPITPATEILQGWILETQKDKSLKYLQTEDETSAGFGVCGAVLAGAKAFTATAGPGHVLMQDPLSMAENLRLPFVAIVMQRGGPSTGTVNFSQQELNLAAFGGNGDGLRVVYSASNIAEMYYLTIKAFSCAWKYRFPTTVLGDGHLSKMRTKAKLTPPIKSVKSIPILAEGSIPTHLRNCYSTEESFGEVLNNNVKAWNLTRNKIAECEFYRTLGAREIILAHGTVADAAKDAVDNLRKRGKKIGLFRPITVHPIAKNKLVNLLKKVKKAYIFESSLNQFSRIIKYETQEINIPIHEITKPALSFTSEEIEKNIMQASR